MRGRVGARWGGAEGTEGRKKGRREQLLLCISVFLMHYESDFADLVVA